MPTAVRREWEYHSDRRSDALLVLTWACTSQCATCSAWRRPRRESQELSGSEWLDVAEALVRRGVRAVELFGGDVFLRKDVVIELSRFLKSAGCDVHIPTNCNLLDEETIRDLAPHVRTLYLSTDGLAGDHDSIRGTPGAFGRVMNALKLLRAARADAKTPTLVCNVTVSRHNVRSLESIAQHAAQSGFDEVHFEYVGEFRADHVLRSRIHDYVPSPIYICSGESSLLPRKEIKILRHGLAGARKLARPGFRVQTVDIDVLSSGHLVNGTIPWRRCFMERNSVVIDPHGNVVPCVFFDTFSLGNVREGALQRSLETQRRALFRSCRARGQWELCKHCILAVVRNQTGLDMIQRSQFTAGG